MGRNRRSQPHLNESSPGQDQGQTAVQWTTQMLAMLAEPLALKAGSGPWALVNMDTRSTPWLEQERATAA
jgi:hypothetical protein